MVVLEQDLVDDSPRTAGSLELGLLPNWRAPRGLLCGFLVSKDLDEAQSARCAHSPGLPPSPKTLLGGKWADA